MLQHVKLLRYQASATSFNSDGWFKTGDIAAVDDCGDYCLVGRASVDVIKSGGYKISALEIERVLLEHPEIEECAVLGVPDHSGVYGEDVCAMVVLKPASIGLSLTSLNQWCKSRIASYKTPRQLLVVPEIPRNAMGKVNKKALRSHFNEL
jgi:malonyl-CoA/methylmalonyl-CoA synthetase